jgi:hypothetical protein
VLTVALPASKILARTRVRILAERAMPMSCLASAQEADCIVGKTRLVSVHSTKGRYHIRRKGGRDSHSNQTKGYCNLGSSPERRVDA